jgi:hypothetical protein
MYKTASQIGDEVLRKLAEGEQLDPQYYEDTPSKKRHWPLAMAGAALGGGAAHYLAPSKMTKDYRATAAGLGDAANASQEALKAHYDPKAQSFHSNNYPEPGKFTNVPKETWDAHKRLVKDVNAGGHKVRFEAPAHVAQKYLKSRAWAEAMPRTLLGAGLGLGAGILGSSMLQ